MQHDFDITTFDANTGSTMRAAINAALQALAGLSSGTSAPGTTYPFQWWMDTSTTPKTLRMRNSANTAWITIGTVSDAGVVILSNAETAGGFTPSQAPAANQIPVLDSNGDLKVGADFVTFLKGAIRHFGASNAASAFGGRDTTYIPVNSYYDGENHVRLVTGAAYLLSIDRTYGFRFYTAADGAAGTAISWVGPYPVWHSGNDGNGSGLDADLWRGLTPAQMTVGNASTVNGLSFNYFAYNITSRDTTYTVNIGATVRFAILNNLTSGNGQVTKCTHSGTNISLSSQADGQSVEVFYIT